MKITKYELQEGQKIRLQWKNKIFEGVIKGNPKEEAKKSAQLTRGMFISIPIITDLGTIKQMPYTNRGIYELIK